MRPLMIGDRERQKIADVVAHADANRFPRSMCQAAMKSGTCICSDPRLSCKLPIGFYCSFSIEEHPCGWCRHLSVSVETTQDRWPSPHAINMLMPLFGFRQPLEECSMVYAEEPARAINVLEVLTP